MRFVIFPLGILALARNEDEHKKMLRQSFIEHCVVAGILACMLLVALTFLLMEVYG